MLIFCDFIQVLYSPQITTLTYMYNQNILFHQYILIFHEDCKSFVLK